LRSGISSSRKKKSKSAIGRSGNEIEGIGGLAREAEGHSTSPAGCAPLVGADRPNGEPCWMANEPIHDSHWSHPRATENLTHEGDRKPASLKWQTTTSESGWVTEIGH